MYKISSINGSHIFCPCTKKKNLGLAWKLREIYSWRIAERPAAISYPIITEYPIR